MQTSNGYGQWLLIQIVGVLPLLASSVCVAQDKVIVQQPGGSRFPISGIVEDYTGREVLLQVRAGEQARRYLRQDVIEVQTVYTAHHEKGRQLLAQGKPVEAKAELNLALKEEDRTWVRREILAQLIRCALWNGDYRAATTSFLSIIESDPETLHYGLAPLNWTNQPSDGSARIEARTWITSRSLTSQLIGASHLLFDKEMNDQADSTLRRLARETNVKLQRMAQMQLWRARSVGGTATPGELARWETSIDELPEELRAGGLFVLGQIYRQQHQPERAASLLLWLPMVYDADRHLAARACFDAAELVESFGDKNQAISLYGELVFRFSDTPLARKAEERWQNLRGPQEKSP